MDQLARLQALLATGGLAGAPKALEGRLCFTSITPFKSVSFRASSYNIEASRRLSCAGDANGAEDDEDEDEEEEEEDWSAEPELFILADAIETGFAELRDKVRSSFPSLFAKNKMLTPF